jgi:hypothetical protein
VPGTLTNVKLLGQPIVIDHAIRLRRRNDRGEMAMRHVAKTTPDALA